MGRVRQYIRDFKRPRRAARFTLDDRIYDPKDGLDVNRMKWGYKISNQRSSMSMHDSANLMERHRPGIYRELGVFKRVGRANKYKSLNLNGQIGKLNKRTYNVR